TRAPSVRGPRSRNPRRTISTFSWDIAYSGLELIRPPSIPQRATPGHAPAPCSRRMAGPLSARGSLWVDSPRNRARQKPVELTARVYGRRNAMAQRALDLHARLLGSQPSGGDRAFNVLLEAQMLDEDFEGHPDIVQRLEDVALSPPACHVDGRGTRSGRVCPIRLCRCVMRCAYGGRPVSSSRARDPRRRGGKRMTEARLDRGVQLRGVHSAQVAMRCTP